MDNISLCSSLVKWLQAFPGLAGATAESLSDGVQLANALHQIEPEFFSSVWISKIRTEVGDNWRLKVSNLHKVHEGVVEFYTDQVGPTIQQFRAPDLKKIGEVSDENELGQLLQLILGCAINCKQKQTHIETIMGMEESIQTVIVNGIQDLMNREGSPHAPGLNLDGPPSYHPQVKSLMEQLESTSLAKEEMDRRCNALDHQISMLVEERNTLKVENEKLNERVDVLEKGGDFGSSRYIDLRKQVDGLQEELYKTESARDEYRLRVDDLEKIVTEVSSKNEELTFLADEARTLKDEVDALRGVSDKVTEYETTIETFKRRQEEFSDLRRQVKILEEKNSNYMQNNLELEEEVKKSGALRPQVDMLRKQITDLHQKLANETKQKDKFAFDAKKLGDKLDSVTQEKDRIMVERFDLQKSIEELRCSVSADSASKSPSDLEDIDALEIVSPQIREKLIRLQHENRLLKRKASEKGGDSSSLLESMLNDLQDRFDRLQLENRWDSSYPLMKHYNNSYLQSKLRLLKRSNKWASESDLSVLRRPSNIFANVVMPSPLLSRKTLASFNNAVAPASKPPIVIRHIHEFKLTPSPTNDDSGCCRTSPSSSEEYRDSLHLGSSSPDYLGTLDSGISGVCRCLSPLIPSIVEECTTHHLSDIIPAARGEGNCGYSCRTHCHPSHSCIRCCSSRYNSDSQDSFSRNRGSNPRSSSVCSESSVNSFQDDFEHYSKGITGLIRDVSSNRLKSKLITEAPPSPTPHNSPRLPHSVNSYRSKSISRSVKISNLAANLEDNWSSDGTTWRNRKSRSHSTGKGKTSKSSSGHIPWNLDDARSVLACRTHLALVTKEFNEANHSPKISYIKNKQQVCYAPNNITSHHLQKSNSSNSAFVRNNPFGCSAIRRNPARRGSAEGIQSDGVQTMSKKEGSIPRNVPTGETKSLEDVNISKLNTMQQRPRSYLGRSHRDHVLPQRQGNVKLMTDSLFTHFMVASQPGNRTTSLNRLQTMSARNKHSSSKNSLNIESAPEQGSKQSMFESANHLLELKLASSAYGAPLVSSESFGSYVPSEASDPDPSATEYYTDQASEEDFDPRRFRLVDARPPLSLKAKSRRTHTTNEQTCRSYYPAQPVVPRQKQKRHLSIKDKFSSMGKKIGKNSKAIVIETFDAVCNFYTP